MHECPKVDGTDIDATTEEYHLRVPAAPFRSTACTGQRVKKIRGRFDLVYIDDAILLA